jgi:hypothetical protein
VVMSALVKSRHMRRKMSCPLYLRSNSPMSALCQKRTHAAQQKDRYSITSSARLRSGTT